MITMHAVGNAVFPVNPMKSHLAYLVRVLLKNQMQLQLEPDMQDMASKG